MWWNVRCFPPASAFSFFCFTHRWRLICMFSTFVLSLKLERFLSTWFFSLNTCHCVFGATNNGAAFLSNDSCWNPEAWMDANMISNDWETISKHWIGSLKKTKLSLCELPVSCVKPILTMDSTMMFTSIFVIKCVSFGSMWIRDASPRVGTRGILEHSICSCPLFLVHTQRLCYFIQARVSTAWIPQIAIMLAVQNSSWGTWKSNICATLLCNF